MTSRITRSLARPSRLAHASLVILGLLIITPPTLAATPRPQMLTESTILEDVSSQGDRPDATCPPDGQCFADVPSTNTFYTFVNRIYQQDLVTGYPCGGPGEPCDPNSRPYYRPVNNVIRQQMSKFIDNSRHLPGIFINTATNGQPLYSLTTLNNGIGIFGEGPNGTGIRGIGATGVRGTGNPGVLGESTVTGGIGVQGAGPTGVKGIGSAGPGVRGEGGASGDGVYGLTGGTSSYAGVEGVSTGASGKGVMGRADSGVLAAGVYGSSTSGFGVYGSGPNTYGVGGFSSGGGSFGGGGASGSW